MAVLEMDVSQANDHEPFQTMRKNCDRMLAFPNLFATPDWTFHSENRESITYLKYEDREQDYRSNKERKHPELPAKHLKSWTQTRHIAFIYRVLDMQQSNSSVQSPFCPFRGQRTIKFMPFRGKVDSNYNYFSTYAHATKRILSSSLMPPLLHLPHPFFVKD